MTKSAESCQQKKDAAHQREPKQKLRQPAPGPFQEGAEKHKPAQGPQEDPLAWPWGRCRGCLLLPEWGRRCL